MSFTEINARNFSNYKNLNIRNANFAPLVHWESEIYGIGRSLRQSTGYPLLLPLYVKSDHGVGGSSLIDTNEISPSLYLTWFKSKQQKMVNSIGLNAVHIKHPWLLWKEANALDYNELYQEKSGTIVFLPHSNQVARPNLVNLRNYLCELKDLDKKYHPVYICLQFHDLKPSLIDYIAKSNLPIVTVGHSLNKNYHSDFYRLVNNFRYATSPNVGSYTFYCIEYGLDYFKFGEEMEWISNGKGLFGKGPISKRLYFDNESEFEERLYFEECLYRKAESDKGFILDYVKKCLGFDSELGKVELKALIINELKKNKKYLFKDYFQYYISSVKNLINAA
jgi:hypothetical protein